MMIGKTKVKKGTIRAKVFRAETGQWEDLGIIASTNIFWKIKNKIKKLWQQYLQP